MAESRSLAPIWRGLPADPKAAAPALLKAFLSGRNESTLRTYRQGLKTFAAFLGRTPDEASAWLFSRRPGDANKLGLDFKAWLMEKGYAAATINNRLAALRSLVHLGKTLGLVGWDLEVEGLRSEAYRDTAGPGMDKILSKIRSLRAGAREDRVAARDVSIVGLLGLMGLRRGEVVSLDFESLDLAQGKLRLVGKGNTQKDPLTIPQALIELLKVWIRHRGEHPGPLFVHFRQLEMKERLSDRSVGRITHKLGLGRAHGLRHAAITEALEQNGGDIRKVARFSRHKNVQTVIRYDDNRKDLGGEVSKGLADKI